MDLAKQILSISLPCRRHLLQDVSINTTLIAFGDDDDDDDGGDGDDYDDDFLSKWRTINC